MKTIVTHFSPDVDAVTSVWLLKRFLPGWEKADVAYVAAGKTLNNSIVDSDKNVLHVDTGLGILDHHQTDEDTCAARRTMEYIAAQIKNLKLKIKNCLILGIGGGDIIKSIKKYYPEAAITGVEIDPTMIDIARKYFGLGEIPKCKIVISDAIDYVRKENPKKFGLIVVDFFVGKLNPPNSRGRNFLLGLKRMKTAEGIIIYNSHYQEDNPDEFRKFKDTCKQVFPYVSEVFAYRNNRVVKLKSDV